ncbi:MAG: hypothetical protein PUC82_02660 [bacterium]|nr:hypothetical protein [bacterium]
MEKKGLALAAMIGGMAAAGYYYLKKNPDVICEMRKMTKELAKKTYEKLDN